jgi:hypothetical protein
MKLNAVDKGRMEESLEREGAYLCMYIVNPIAVDEF